MKVILPVAGEGTRLRPHTYTTPKVLIPVGGKPMLGHILDQLIGLNFSEVVFVVGYKGDQIEEYVKANYKFKATFVEQKDTFGLGHAVYVGMIDTSEDILVVLGDTIAELDWKGLAGSGQNCLAVMEVDDPSSFGVVEVDDERIVALVEKPKDPPSNLAVVGVYYISETKRFYKYLDEIVQRGITSHGEIQLTDAFDLFLKEGGDLRTFPITGWHDCGKVETIIETNRYLLEKKAKKVKKEGSVIIHPSLIASTARVEGSILGPYVSLGPDAVIRNSIISDSIIAQGAQIDSAILTKSLVGSGAVINGKAATHNIGDSSVVGDD
jgi:glucose-1-phosphate thymidylyltransferase